jgi:dihydropteroate synthase
MAFFSKNLESLTRAGLPEARVVLDPGIGFGKTLAHNLKILQNIERFYEFGRPVYMGLSNKSLWKGLLGRDGRDRNAATLAATVALYGRGVRIHRVHEVRETRDGLVVAQTLGKTGEDTPRC